MNVNTSHRPLNKVAEQLTNNSTGWVGQLMNIDDSMTKGQSFIADRDGEIREIDIFSNLVTRDGMVSLSLYNYDSINQSWGSELGSVSVKFQRSDSGKWIPFEISGPVLRKGHSYAFKLHSDDAYIGLGEACGSYSQPPLLKGQEWKFCKSNPTGDSFTYFSLAFQVHVAAA